MVRSMLAVPVLFAAVAFAVPGFAVPDGIINQEGYSFWRVTNYDDCGWRPGVTDFMMYADASMTQPFTHYELISSGYNPDFSEAEVGPHLAVDGSPSTSWRPQLHAPSKGRVWIGMKFDRPVQVRAAKAVGLGIGRGAGEFWSGGVELQASHDGTDWVSVAHQSKSNYVLIHEAGYPYWRVTNYDDCGWRPAVTEFMMYADASMSQPFSHYELISSGYSPNFPESRVGPQRAVDGNPSTSWRPHLHDPAKGQAWIGMKFDRDVQVMAAKAVGLGVGHGGGHAWNGGLELQASRDGIHWFPIAHQIHSNAVVVPELGFPYWRVTNYDDCGWRPEVTEFMMYADESRSQPFSRFNVISSGFNPDFPESRVGAHLALDGNPNTAWRPQIHAPAKGQVWIGMRFDRPVLVRAATAVGLGIGHGAGEWWNGGLDLQASRDGIHWVSVAHQTNSNDVVFDPGVTSMANLLMDDRRFEPFPETVVSSPRVRAPSARILHEHASAWRAFAWWMQRHLEPLTGSPGQQALQRQVLV